MPVRRLAPWVVALLALAIPALAASAPIGIVAAENFYGDVAAQIGGADVKVTSILSNPDQDPHLFEVSAAVGRAVSGARIVVENGIDYDPWMEKLLKAARAPDRAVIVVAELAGKKTGENPHIWYDPSIMLTYARALADALRKADPAHADAYAQRLRHFEASLTPIEARIAALRARLAGMPATATEPVFGSMFAALGMEVRNMPFQIAVMNGTEPAASDVAAFERDLKTHQVKLLVYNAQATDAIATRMAELAHASQVPVLGVTETEPPGTTYQAWMMGTLAAVDRALPAKAP
jgi:zinc/manganese transport system substrate-binding protein